MEEINKEQPSEKGKTVLSWLNSHWVGNKKCPICLHSDWGVDVSSGAIIVAKNNTLSLNEYFPITVVYCKFCGYSFILNEIIMGLEKSKLEKSVTSDNKGDITENKSDSATETETGEIRRDK